MISEFYANLIMHSNNTANRYRNKIQCINQTDPFAIPVQKYVHSSEFYPNITTSDIMVYLVFRQNFYTSEQMMTYKSLNSYKLFALGFVQLLGVSEINNYKVVIAKVQNSQRNHIASFDTWIISEANGFIVNAHCSCMTGTPDVCCHIGATLYATESLKCQNQIQSSSTSTSTDYMTKNENCSFKDLLSKMTLPLPTEAPSPAFEERWIDATNAAALMPSYEGLYKAEYEHLTLNELMLVMPNITITAEECTTIFDATKRQSDCCAWYMHRMGRITASAFRTVCCTEKPSLSLIKRICYPMKTSINKASFSWSKRNKMNAIKKFVLIQKANHTNFDFTESGLVINPILPEFAATPDGIASCNCCGIRCVEIKCPLALKGYTIDQYAELKHSFLEVNSDGLQLKREHAYYYQVQLQMKLCGRKYGEFVVWSPNDFFIEVIPFDEKLWERCLPKAITFHSRVVMPELMAKYYTKCYGAVDAYSDGS